MPVLITGITGFIGSQLGRVLVAQGEEVYAIVRRDSSRRRIADYADRVRLIEADLFQPASYRPRLEEVRPERAFHLAWFAEPGRFWTAVENLACVSMTLSLAQCLAETGCRHLIAAGSCAEYSWQHGFLSEDFTPTEASSLYGVAKNAARQVLEAYTQSFPMAFSWARFFFPFGPGEPEPRLIPSVTLQLLRGERARCSHGQQIRDFVYVEDCVTALMAIAEHGLEGCVNIGTGAPTRIGSVVESLAELTGRSSRDIEFGAVPTDPDEPPMLVADPRKLARGTGWRPARTLEAALAETVEWWRKAE